MYCDTIEVDVKTRERFNRETVRDKDYGREGSEVKTLGLDDEVERVSYPGRRPTEEGKTDVCNI